VLDGLKPYTAYKESGVPWLGKVPEQWEVLRARYLFREVDVRSATGAETHLSMSQRHGLIRSADLAERRLISESYVGAKICAADDLVLNRLKAHLGVFARASEPGLVSPDYTVLRPLSTRALSPFFECLLKSYASRQELRSRAKGLVEGFWRLYTDDFYSIAVPAPPPDDQRAITRFLDHVDRRIRRYAGSRRRLIEILEERAKTVVRELVTCGVVPARLRVPCDVGWLRNVPAHWDVRPLRRCARPLGGMTPSMADRSLWGGDVPWVTPKDMKQPRIKDSIDHVTRKTLSVTSLTEVPAPAVLLVVRGMILARTIPIAVTEGPVTVNQDMKALLPVADVDADFLALALVAARDELATMIDEAGHGTKRLPMGRWRDLPIPVPPVEEQQEAVRQIAHATSDLARAIAAIRREVVLLKEFQERLIADVVTGKLDVRAALSSLPPDVEVNDETETIEEAQDDAAGELAEDLSAAETDT
jgi:type I restriction enzyme S subunit